MSKYNAKKTVIDGITFASKREAARFAELKLMQRAGLISDLRRQVKYELIPKQQGERAVSYIADFVYTENGKTIVEDVKGVIEDAITKASLQGAIVALNKLIALAPLMEHLFQTFAGGWYGAELHDAISELWKEWAR